MNSLPTSQKGAVLPLLLVVLLIGGLIVGVRLAQERQIFSSQAAERPECTQDDFPMFQNDCAKCISDSRPGLVTAIQNMRNINCNVPKMISLWCNGNESDVYNHATKSFGTGERSYNTSPEATDACIKIMDTECYQQCRDTVINHTIGTCQAVTEGFPAQPLAPNTKYTFKIRQTEMDGVPDFPNHVGIRRDGIPQEAHPTGPGFVYIVTLDSGAPGTHNLVMAYNDTSIYKKETGVDPADPKQIRRFAKMSEADYEALSPSQKEALSKSTPTSVVEAPRYIARVVCLDMQYQVSGTPAPATPQRTIQQPTTQQPTSLPAPGRPQITCTNDSHVKMSWPSVTGASGYRVRLDKQPGTSPWFDNVDRDRGDYLNDFYPSTSIEFDVIPGVPYKFWLSAYNDNVINSDASENVTFTCSRGF